MDKTLRIANKTAVWILLNSPPETVSIGDSCPLLITTMFNFSPSKRKITWNCPSDKSDR